MANEMKACCGGFLVGDGLTMEGKVLKATGGSGGGNETFTIQVLTKNPVTVDKTDEEIIDAIKKGKTIRAVSGSLMLTTIVNADVAEVEGNEIYIIKIKDVTAGKMPSSDKGYIHANTLTLSNYDPIQSSFLFIGLENIDCSIVTN